MQTKLQEQLEMLGKRLQQTAVTDFLSFSKDAIEPMLYLMESMHQQHMGYRAGMPQYCWPPEQITDLYDFSAFMKTQYKQRTQNDPDYEIKNAFFQVCEAVIDHYDNANEAIVARYGLFWENLLPEYLNYPVLLENLKYALRESLLYPIKTPSGAPVPITGKRRLSVSLDRADLNGRPSPKRYRG